MARKAISKVELNVSLDVIKKKTDYVNINERD